MRLTALMLYFSYCLAQTTTVSSPDGQIKVTISDEQHTPSYEISFAGKQVIANSLGLVFKQPAMSEGYN